jgi:hypothetical protein
VLRLCRNVFFLVAIFIASAAAGAIAATSDTNSPTVLVVTLDRDAYAAREMYLLKAQVETAFGSKQNNNEVGIAPGGTAARVTILDSARDRNIADKIEQQFSKRPGYSLKNVPAVTISITWSSHEPDHKSRDTEALIFLVESLRPLPPGVTIETGAGSSIVTAVDTRYADRLKRTLGDLFDIMPLSKTSWRVEWSKSILQTLSPGRRSDSLNALGPMLRDKLGDPEELETERTKTGAAFTIPNPQLYGTFIDTVKSEFTGKVGFAISETKSLILDIAPPIAPPVKPTELAKLLPPDEIMQTMSELQSLANPPTEITVEGNAVLVQSHDPERNADCAAIVRDALATRSDLQIVTEPDQSLRISLTTGTHIGVEAPAFQPGQLVAAIKNRLNRLNISPSDVKPIDIDHTRVTFESAMDADKFRNDLSNKAGLSIRLVDDAVAGDASPPPSGDEKFHLAQPDRDIWVKPDAIITGDMIADAKAGTNPEVDQPDVEFRFTDEGRIHFAAATRANVGGRFAIIVDGKAIEAPRILDPVLGGSCIITGGFTADSAKALAASVLPPKDGLLLKIE